MDTQAKSNALDPHAANRGLRAVFRSLERLDQIYEETLGEETEEAAEAERVVEESGALALDALAEFVAAHEARVAAAKAEQKRLGEVVADSERRVEWAKEHLAKLTEGKRGTVRAGLHSIKRTKTEKIVEGVGFDLAKLPEEFARYTTPKPAVRGLDKAKAKKAIKAGTEIEGLSLVAGVSIKVT